MNIEPGLIVVQWVGYIFLLGNYRFLMLKIYQKKHNAHTCRKLTRVYGLFA